MKSEFHGGYPVLISIAIIFAAGCTSTTPVTTDSGDAHERMVDPVADSSPEPDDDVQTLSAIEELLVDRRRGDYPEIESEEFGFTVTEQIRIGGDSYARYEAALGLLGQERFAEAIVELIALTEDSPEITAPYVDLGIAYRHIGDLELAAAALETAALLSPEHPIVHNELGIVYRRSGRFEAARSEYEKALAVFSDFHFARRNLAVLCDLYLADIECALQNYRMYLESAGTDAEVEIWIADLSSRVSQDR